MSARRNVPRYCSRLVAVLLVGAAVSLLAAAILGNFPLSSTGGGGLQTFADGSGRYRVDEAFGRSRVHVVLGTGRILDSNFDVSAQDSRLPRWLGDLPASEAPISVRVFEASGWPARALVTRPGHPSVKWSLVGRSLRIPRGVWWPGVALNTLVGIAVIVVVCEGTRKLRAWNRKRSGLCLACGYELAGLSHRACPECGMEHQRG